MAEHFLFLHFIFMFMFFFVSSPEVGGWWNTKGCEVVSKQYGYTVCYCNHTTNFALLLQIYEAQVAFLSQISTTYCVESHIKYVLLFTAHSVCVCVCVCVCVRQKGEENEKALQVLTFIGCGVSLCGLLFTFILFITVG